MPDGLLGCGTWTVYVQERGGAVRLAELPYTALRGGRRLEETSEGSVVVPTGPTLDPSCCETLEILEDWVHEISMWRGNEEAWVGPVLDVRFAHADATIGARDLGQWLERRLPPKDRIFEQDDLADVLETLVLDALSRDPSPNLTVHTLPSGIIGPWEVRASDFRRAADDVRALGRVGVDWTVVGRRMLAGGLEIPTPHLGILTDEVLELDPLLLSGLTRASEVTVLGGNSSSPVVGVAGGIDPRIGLVQDVVTESSVLTEPIARIAAQTRLELLQSPPPTVEGRLLPEAPVEFSDLVPGAHVELRCSVGCRTIVGDFRLHDVSWDVTTSEAGVTENVRVRFLPLGTVEGG